MIETQTQAPGNAAIRSAFGDVSWGPEELITELADPGRRAEPFEPLNVAFCAALSAELMALRNDPDAVALGYWLRRAAVVGIEKAFRAGLPSRALAVPRGLAFHVTPGNVETVFVHSWVLSLLAGNANIVRLASRESETRGRMLAAIAGLLSDARFAQVAARNRLVVTGHDDETLRALSGACDVRILWGGNETIRHYRDFPLKPAAHEIVFPDRHSLALLDAQRVAEASDGELARIADAFFRDAFWHDQGACSSPRLLIWRVGEAALTETGRARARLRAAVDDALRERDYVAETGMAITKMVTAMERASRAEGLVIDRVSNEITWVRLPDLSVYDRDSCGGGLFFEVESQDLAGDLLRFARPEDQTATCFGIAPEEVRELARQLNGRGVDRFVDVGQALAFDPLWDGMDLLRELTRLVVVDVGSAGSGG